MKKFLSNRKILVGVGVVAIVAAVIIGGTVAYFSDTETSVGNTFVAGKLNLQIDNTCHYNGKVCANGLWGNTQEPCACTWELKDLNGELYFNLLDVKPGDSGEDTISLHVINNDAWLCAEIENLKNDDNGCENPETKAGDGTCGFGEGELQGKLLFSVWKDNGASTNACNNIKDTDEGNYIIENQPAQAGIWPIADSSNGGVPLPGGTTLCYGVSWTLPLATGNEVQGDGLVGDVIFSAVQSRHMDNFKCSDLIDNGETGECSIAADCGDDSLCTIDDCINGTCSYETVNCVDGNQCMVDTCNPAVGCQHVVPPESCGDGIDNDCDTLIDEGCLICIQTNGGIEICDNIDNDCDGNIDEGLGGNACDGEDADLCQEGVVVCQGVNGLVCNDNTGSSVEVCDNIDNDCDGENNEGGVCVAESDCRDTIDNDQDGVTDCNDPGCYFTSPLCQLNTCGNEICESGETFENCPTDCPAPLAPQCTTNNDCNNDKPCTTDTCVNGSCVHTPNNSWCSTYVINSCQLATCVGAAGDMNGCAYQATTPGASCSDLGCMLGGSCVGYTCSAIGACVAPAFPPPPVCGNCDDGNACTFDSCLGNACTHANVVPSQCIFGGTCTGGVVTCNPNPNCANNCDDGNACTIDICNLFGCTHTDTTPTNCVGAAFGFCNPSNGTTGCMCIFGTYPSCGIDIDLNPFD